MAENRSKSDGFMLRFPPEMRNHVKEAADANGRSMNAEIIHRIEAYDELLKKVDDADKNLAMLNAGFLKMLPQYQGSKKLIKQWIDLANIAQPFMLEVLNDLFDNHDGLADEDIDAAQDIVKKLHTNIEETNAIIADMVKQHRPEEVLKKINERPSSSEPGSPKQPPEESEDQE
ncbi:Arc family DNA-binding protein [Martelella alba]|uniref:Arc family DNA-binding protein n=1 Tax=Martelella alba TaxID=2590451 RepID=A0A506U8U7_9HYPH|nr:Arc family DNA-binding protein [Martelella alba]TPW30320.1 Arc family DNA-binding protein [Martelella alba]